MASLPIPVMQPQPGSLARPASPAIVGTAPTSARLSALEWSIVAMAERDGLASIREESRYTRALRNFFGFKRPNGLANERLEVLRRVAVLAWHHGWNVPNSELAAFFEAGFTSDHHELIQNSLGQVRIARAKRRPR